MSGNEGFRRSTKGHSARVRLIGSGDTKRDS
jgi:hypothetical protein